MIEIRNAIIRSATLSTADHGLLSSFLELDYGGSSQGFGGYGLFAPQWPNKGNYAGLWIWRCLEIADVVEWSHLKGKTIRAKCEHAKVHAIGHVIKDIWFDPSTEFKTLEGMRVVPPKEGIFRDHRCWKCNDGEKPCAHGGSHRCEYPRARND